MSKNLYDYAKTIVDSPSVGDIVVVLTVGLYVSGLLLTNLFLGWFGVPTLELLRVRYLIAGGMFFVFCAVTLASIEGFFGVLRSSQCDDPLALIWRVFMYSFSLYAFLLILGYCIQLLYGRHEYSIVVFPKVPVGFGSLIIAFLFLSSVVYALISAPPVGWPQEWFKNRNALGNALTRILLTVSPYFAFVALRYLFTPVHSTDRIVSIAMKGMFTYGVERFIWTILSIYYLSAMIGFAVFLTSKCYEKEPLFKKLPSKYHYQFPLDRIQQLLLFTALILPVYAVSVYPAIPRHLGGGALTEVKRLGVGSHVIEGAKSTDRYYLLDYTPQSYFVILSDDTGDKYRVVEIRSENVEYIEYTSDGEVSVTPITPAGTITSTQAISTTPP